MRRPPEGGHCWTGSREAARLVGYHRGYCIRSQIYRGTPQATLTLPLRWMAYVAGFGGGKDRVLGAIERVKQRFVVQN